MGRFRFRISGLMVVVVMAAIVFASLREGSGVGVNLFFCIALALNFAAVVILPTGLNPRIRMSALGYAIGGCGWLTVICFVPWIDLMIRDNVVVPIILKTAAPRSTPLLVASHPFVRLVLLLTHSLCDIAAGIIGALVAWSLSYKFVPVERSILQTTGEP